MRTTRPNHALQRTRPSHHCCNRGIPWAGSLSLGRSTTQKPTRPDRNITAFLGQDEQDLQDGSDHGGRQDGSCPSCYPVQNPGSFFSSGAVYQDWLAGSFPPEVPMRSVELDGPANGSQPARRVAMWASRVAGTRR
jgi:hypothetical protein